MLTYTRVVASKFDKDSFIGVMPESFGKSGVGTIELFHTYGFASRPADMDASGACGMMSDADGPTGYSFLLNDGRVQSKLPEIKLGESFQYGITGAFSRIGADGVISLFTTDDTTVNGRSIYLQVGPKGLSFVFPYGKLTFDDTGFHVLTNAGARIDLGALAAPAPLDVLSSYATLSGGMVHVEGSAVHVGTSTGIPQAVALATSTVALFSALGAVLTALAEPGAYVSASPGSPAAPGPGLLAAISSAETLIGSASTTVPSVSSTATGI